MGGVASIGRVFNQGPPGWRCLGAVAVIGRVFNKGGVPLAWSVLEVIWGRFSIARKNPSAILKTKFNKEV